MENRWSPELLNYIAIIRHSQYFSSKLLLSLIILFITTSINLTAYWNDSSKGGDIIHPYVKRETCNGAECPPKSYCRQFNGNQERCQCVERFYKKGKNCFEADAVCDVQMVVRLSNYEPSMTDSGSKGFNELEEKFTHGVDTILKRTYQQQYRESTLVSVNTITTMQKIAMKIMFESDDSLPEGKEVENVLNKFIRQAMGDIKVETLDMKPPCDRLQVPPSVQAIVAHPQDTSAKIEWTFRTTLNIDQITLSYGLESEELGHFQSMNMSSEQSVMELTDLKPGTNYVVFLNTKNKVGKGIKKVVRFATTLPLKTADPQAIAKTTVIIICGIVIASFILIAVAGFILLRRDETGEMIIKKIIRKRKRKKVKNAASTPGEGTDPGIIKQPVDPSLPPAASATGEAANPDAAGLQPPSDYYYDDYYYNDYAYETIPVPLTGGTMVEGEYDYGAKYDDYYYNDGQSPVGADGSALQQPQTAATDANPDNNRGAALNWATNGETAPGGQPFENIPLNATSASPSSPTDEGAQLIPPSSVEQDNAPGKRGGSTKKKK